MKIIPIPEPGLRGETALKEAAAGEYRTIIDLVRGALMQTLHPGAEDSFVRIEAIYADRVVIADISFEGRLFSYPYTLNESNQVELGMPQEVILEHRPVSAMREAQGVFIEAKDDKGMRWLIRVIRAGLSGNRNYYPDTMLREATPLFDGARVFVKSDEQHLAGQGKSFHNLIGRLTQPEFIRGKSNDTGEVRAVLELLEAAGEIPAKLLEAWRRNMAKDLFGFSIDADGEVAPQRGRRVAKKITKVNSVDLIIEPGAGGELINLIEAKDPQLEADMKLRERMIEAVKKANGGKLPDGLNVEDEDKLETAYREAIAKETQAAQQARTGTDGGSTLTREDLEAHTRLIEARAHLRAAVAESGLPDLAKTRIKKQFEKSERFTEAEVDEAIEGERQYLATLTESGHVSGLGGGSLIESGEDRSEKVSTMLDAFWDRAHKDHRSVQSFKECYIEITGDKRVTGRLENMDRRRLSEAVGAAVFRESLDAAALGNVLGASLRRAMIREYGVESNYDIWRLIADTVPAQDFRTNERTRFGGYGDLPIVAEGAGYTALASPTDEKATYAVAKRGGTEDITLEQIKDDDVGVIRRVPVKLARSAKRTLSKFVLDFIRNNPVIYDGLALYHASHNNLFTVALSLAEYGVHRLAMLKQTELSSADRIGIAPAFLLGPFDVEETATNLFTQGTENEKKFLSSIRPTVVSVWYWTDANDWATVADKNDVPFIEVGFLDGQEEPELFVQDNPTVGSMFSNDKLTWKIRHIYGGNVLDFRGTTKAVVP